MGTETSPFCWGLKWRDWNERDWNGQGLRCPLPIWRDTDTGVDHNGERPLSMIRIRPARNTKILRRNETKLSKFNFAFIANFLLIFFRKKFFWQQNDFLATYATYHKLCSTFFYFIKFEGIFLTRGNIF